MTRWITTWFYQQTHSEGGAYAQVRGDSSSEEFRDVYRRCIAVFFETARASNPDAKLVLFLNREWDTSASPVAEQVARRLSRIGVSHQVIQYSHAPPDTFPPRWRNQFFVLDVLEALTESVTDHDLALILDSDIVWTESSRAEDLWSSLAREGALTYTIGYDLDADVNGLSRRALRQLAFELGTLPVSHGPLDYSGGEIVALRGDTLRRVVRRSADLWPKVLERHRTAGTTLEEAHFLTMVYAAESLPTGYANAHIKRIWTQPFKPRNVAESDLNLTLWHIPAEKKYGLARLFRVLARPANAHDQRGIRFARLLGIPSNSHWKILLDTSSAVLSRASLLATRLSLGVGSDRAGVQ